MILYDTSIYINDSLYESAGWTPSFSLADQSEWILMIKPEQRKGPNDRVTFLSAQGVGTSRNGLSCPLINHSQWKIIFDMWRQLARTGWAHQSFSTRAASVKHTEKQKYELWKLSYPRDKSGLSSANPPCNISHRVGGLGQKKNWLQVQVGWTPTNLPAKMAYRTSSVERVGCDITEPENDLYIKLY